MISDNASTYLLAAEEVTALFSTQTLKSSLSKQGVDLRFIPKRINERHKDNSEEGPWTIIFNSYHPAPFLFKLKLPWMTDHWHMFLPTHTMKKRSLNPIFYTGEGSQPFPTLELNRSRWDPNYTQKGDARRELHFQNTLLFSYNTFKLIIIWKV